MTTEADDPGYYYLADFVTQDRGDDGMISSVRFFDASNFDSNFIDLRDPGFVTGYALVRCPHDPSALMGLSGAQGLPAGIHPLGRGVLSPLPSEARVVARQELGLRGQIETIKDLLRLALLTEAGERGKPGKLTPEESGDLVVYLGDLRIDLLG